MSIQLNYTKQGEGATIVLLHGLFGNLDNLGLLARDFATDHHVVSVDLRNHGLSCHSNVHSYQAMADDLHKLISSLNLSSIHLVGHSMGGKVAMKYAADHPEMLKSLIVMDMAPVIYSERKHDNVFAGLVAVNKGKPSNRNQAMEILSEHIELEGVRQFLGKSLYRDPSDNTMRWRFNVESLLDNYQNIIGWEQISACNTATLFLKGADSDYITEQHQAEVSRQFPNAKAHVIANTGHWLHAEKPQQVIRAIRRFIAY